MRWHGRKEAQVSDTPRTDGLTFLAQSGMMPPYNTVPSAFAQQLERELAVVTEQRDGLRAGIDYASDQLTKVKEQRDGLHELHNKNAARSKELLELCGTLREQRDGIEGMYHEVIAAVLECDPIPACQREDDQLEPPWEVITRIREQRDRLAEALRKAVCPRCGK